MVATPLVTYVVPCYNCSRYIAESVQSVLRQDYPSLEIIVVDDGSTDGSQSKIECLAKENESVFFACHPGNSNLGVSSSRRLGVRLSRGEYICFLDADDVLLDPGKTRKQVDSLNADKSLCLVHTSITVIGDLSRSANFEETHNKQPIGPYRFHKQPGFLERSKICNSTVMIRKKLLDNLEWDIPQLFQYEDWMLWILLSSRGNFLHINLPAVGYRVHSGSFMASVRKSELRHQYSLIEMKIALLARQGLSLLGLSVLISLTRDLSRLIALYERSRISDKVLPLKQRVITVVVRHLLDPVAPLRTLLSKAF